MKPILFNTDMVRAILEGRKAVTRRVVKPQPFAVKQDENAPCWCGHFVSESGKVLVDKPPYRPGDILYVRETWTKLWYVDLDGYTHYDQPMYYYAADGTPDITLCDEDGFEQDDQRIRWHSSIHMPREAARIFLRVTDVRVEMLQEITEPEAEKEGLRYYDDICRDEDWHPTFYDPDSGGSPSTVIGFIRLWGRTIKPKDRALYGWDANPWVWAIEFERCDKPEAAAYE